MDTFQQKIDEHNTKIWDRIGWTGSVTPGTAVDVISSERFGDSVQIWPYGDKSIDYVRHSNWVSEKNGEIVVETWVVNRENNYGFSLEDLHITDVSEDKLVATLLEHFKKLTCAAVQKAYDAIYD
jgi:hypothetical protein